LHLKAVKVKCNCFFYALSPRLQGSRQIVEMKTYPIIMGKGCPRILVRFQKAVFFPTIVSGILIQVLPDPAPSSVKSCAKFCFTLSLFQSKDSIFTFRNSEEKI